VIILVDEDLSHQLGNRVSVPQLYSVDRWDQHFRFHVLPRVDVEKIYTFSIEDLADVRPVFKNVFFDHTVKISQGNLVNEMVVVYSFS